MAAGATTEECPARGRRGAKLRDACRTAAVRALATAGWDPDACYDQHSASILCYSRGVLSSVPRLLAREIYLARWQRSDLRTVLWLGCELHRAVAADYDNETDDDENSTDPDPNSEEGEQAEEETGVLLSRPCGQGLISPAPSLPLDQPLASSHWLAFFQRVVDTIWPTHLR
jgi:hypothetical protein